MRVLVPRSGCVFAALQAGFGLAAGVMAAFVGYGLFLLVTPSDTAGAGLSGAVGSLLVVLELFGFSVMATAFGAGLAGPISRQRLLWQNGLAIVVPLAFGLAGTGFAAYASYKGSPNIYDFVRLLSFFMAEPVLLVFGLAAAEMLWRYKLPGGAKGG